MTSVFTVDLGSDAQKVQEQFENLANLTIGSGAKDIADAAVTSVAEKTKAEVDMIIASIEATVQDIIDNGTSQLYSALGINEETVEFARNVVSLATHATNLAASAVLKGMVAVNSFDTVNYPMSAYAAGLKAVYSIADVFFKDFMEAYGTYIDLVIQYIVDPGAAVEDLNKLIEQQMNTIEDYIDAQCQQYLGLSLVQIRYYCRKGMNYYKQYKAAKKKQREKESKTEEEQQSSAVETATDDTANVSATGTSRSLSIDYEMNPDVVKGNLDTWLNSQRDSLYNAFLILQIKDAVNDIRSMIKCMTDVNLETLADNMNSLDDLISLLEDLGLDDDSTAIDLSLIPSLNINEMYAAMNSLTNTSVLQSEIASLGGAVASTIASATSVSASISKTTTYTITTDASTGAITVTYYTDPTKSSVAKAVNKVFTNAETANGTKMFSSANCKVIQEYTNSLYNANKTTGSGSVTIIVNKYTINIVLAIPQTTTDSSTGSSSSGLTSTVSEISSTTSSSTASSTVELSVMEEESKTAEQLEQERNETRRNTIALLHTVFSIIKAVFPSMKVLATLISNYKTNKAYAQGKSQESLYALFQECMSKLGLDKTASASGGTDENGNPRAVLYPVRTYAMYSYLKDDLGLLDGSPVTVDITTETVIEINKWIGNNDTTASTLSTDNPVTLYIDYVSINDETECIESQTTSLETCSSKYQNGSFDNIDNVEIAGDTIMYSDSSLPRMGSQILMAQMRGYSYDE